MVIREEWSTVERKIFEGERKTFANFVAIRESFLHEIWGVMSFGAAKASNPQNFFHENRIFHQFAKILSHESFLVYGISVATYSMLKITAYFRNCH